MKNTYLLLLTTLVIAIYQSNVKAQGGVWIYWKGSQDNMPYDSGHYGTMGVANAANVPPGRYQCAYWRDLKGNFWVFGGATMWGDINDMWMYSPKTNMWTWMNGPNRGTNNAGSWGTQGVPSPTNCPAGRGYGANCMTDNNGDLWLYGGLGGTDDLWRYNIASNEWTWIAGHNTSVGANHGIMGVSSIYNTPGTRNEVKSSWVDSANNIWMFGGNGTYNDVWKFNISTNKWTWMKGDSGTGVGNYGIQGVEKATNEPSGRYSYTKWKDSKGNFYIFAGGFSGYKNDVWRFNPHTNNWTWMAGDSMPGDTGHYIKKCQFGHGNMPCARIENQTAQTLGCSETFWTFGGFYGSSKYGGCHSDLWLYDTRTSEWSWVFGTPNADPGVYGAPGVALSTNAIGARGGVGTWTDSLNHLWVFGGYNYSISTQLNDLWEFIPDTNCIPSKFFVSAGNIPAPADTNHCANQATYLNIKGIKNIHVKPNDGSYVRLGNGDSALFRPKKTTTYTVTYGNGGACAGSGTITFTVHVKGANSDFTFPDTMTTLLSPAVKLTGYAGAKGTKFQWLYNGSVYSTNPDTVINFTTAGTHCFSLVTIDTSSLHCSDTVTHCIKVHDTALIFAPTAFSPKGMGPNKKFRLIYGDKIEVKKFQIFNRWGQMVYDRIDQPWDGTFNGQPAEMGTYIYYIEAVNLANHRNVLKKGAVLLLR